MDFPRLLPSNLPADISIRVPHALSIIFELYKGSQDVLNL